VALTRQQVVDKAVKAITTFHAIGTSLPKKQSRTDADDRGAMSAAATKYRMNPDTVRKARQFADPTFGYSTNELKALRNLIREVQSTQDAKLPVFKRTHLIRMLTVPKPDRPTFQEEAVNNAWSLAKLENEIAIRFGQRGDGGRRRHFPADRIGLMTQLEGLCETWTRWQRAVDPMYAKKLKRNKKKRAEPSKPPDHATLADLPSDVQKHVRAVGIAMASLHRTVTTRLTKDDPKREVRFEFRADDT
jgi:hypothetical protein